MELESPESSAVYDREYAIPMDVMDRSPIRFPRGHNAPPLPLTTMAATSQRPSRRGDIISLFNAAIEAVNFAKEASSITPAKAAFASAGILLTMIKVCFILCDEMFQVYTQPGIDG